MRKTVTALLIAVVIGLVGCTAGGEGKGLFPSGKPIHMSMVADIGGIKDQSFNQSAWEGLQKAGAEFQMDVGYIESESEEDYEKNIQELLDSDPDLIWGIGFKMADAIKKFAVENPNQKFAIIDYDYGEESLDNVLGVVFKAEEPSYLMGTIAAKMTKTEKVGFIGGMDTPSIHRFLYGFIQGVEDTDPAIEVQVEYADAFDSPSKGKKIAKKMYDQGVDLIFHAAGDTGNGVIEAAKELDKMVIGVDKDQNILAPEHVISSAVKRIDLAMYEVAKQLKEGRFSGGKTLVLGLKESGVEIAGTTGKHVPSDVLQLVEENKMRIMNGEIVVSDTEEAYQSIRR